MILINSDTVLGISDAHLIKHGERILHKQSLKYLQVLELEAQQAGFDLAIASAWRNFDRQLTIWNEKATGKRAVLDDLGQALDIHTLSDEQLMWKILRWSALPGASRHHWGTDFDVYCRKSLPQGYRLQLSREETDASGVLGPFHAWLDEHLEQSLDFFRPYQQPFGGVAPEPWHLSCAPLSKPFQELLSEGLIKERIEASDIALKAVILKNLDEIFQRFIWVSWDLYPEC